MQRTRTRRGRRGFTLMEVLLVLAILVILGSTVTFYFVGTQKKGYIRSAKIQISSIEQMLKLYVADVGSFPSTQQGLDALLQPPADMANPAKWAGPYSEKALPNDPWDNPYQYELLGAEQYRVWSMGPDGQNGTEDDVSNLTAA